MYWKIPDGSGWKNILFKQSESKLVRQQLGKTRLHDSQAQAAYHRGVLGERCGTYDLDSIVKSDGSLKPYRYEEASVEDRQSVQESIRENSNGKRD